MANEKTYPNYLMHYRTKGSKNGVSRTKGYTAVGQKAKGQYINGRYVYDEGTKNNWQQLGNAHRSGLTMNNSNSRAQDYRGMPNSVTSEIISRDNARMEKRPEVKAFNAWHNARQQHNAEVAGKNAAWEYQQKQAAVKNANGRYVYGTTKSYGRNVENTQSGNVSKPRPSANLRGALNNWQQQGNTFRAANEAHERFGSGKSRGIARGDQQNNYGGYGTHATLEGSTRALNAAADLGKLRREKKNLSLYGSGDTKTRNSRSDIANAFADAKDDAKNAFKTMKKKAALSIFNKFSTGIRKDKRKKKSLKDLFK